MLRLNSMPQIRRRWLWFPLALLLFLFLLGLVLFSFYSFTNEELLEMTEKSYQEGTWLLSRQVEIVEERAGLLHQRQIFEICEDFNGMEAGNILSDFERPEKYEFSRLKTFEDEKVESARRYLRAETYRDYEWKPIPLLLPPYLKEFYMKPPKVCAGGKKCASYVFSAEFGKVGGLSYELLMDVKQQRQRVTYSFLGVPVWEQMDDFLLYKKLALERGVWRDPEFGTCN